MIEVERKFVITPGTRDSILSLGGSLMARKHLHDTYYDTANYPMVQKDHWLRKRGERWELKCRHHLTRGQEEEEEGASIDKPGWSPKHEDKVDLQDASDRKIVLQNDDDDECKGVLKGTDQYREETNEHAILAHLEEVFQIRTKAMEMLKFRPGLAVTMDMLLECGVLVPLVEVGCVRESYVVRGGGEGGGCECDEVRVDLDECECYEGGGGGKYGVGEVEIMVSSPTDVEHAAQKCRDLALHLGELNTIFL